MKNKKLIILISLLFILSTIFVVTGITTDIDNSFYSFVHNKLGFLHDYFLFITKFGDEEIVIILILRIHIILGLVIWVVRCLLDLFVILV